MSDDVLDLALKKRLGTFSLEVSEGLPLAGVTSVFGPSGSGKSTLLRLIAGLERPDVGRIVFGDQVWCDTDARRMVPAYKRPVAYMFQDARLLQHLSVRDNLAYADRRRRMNRASFAFDDVVTAFDLGSLIDRRPATLSGGERQRVALAQALLARPDIILLDEPLSALDRQRKDEILPYLENLHNMFATPIVHVSHDIEEVCRLADRVVVLDGGRVTDTGPAVDVLNRQGFGTDATARTGVILAGKITAIDDRLKLVDVGIGEDHIRLAYRTGMAAGALVRVIIKASDVSLAVEHPVGLSIQNVLAGRVRAIRINEGEAMADVVVSIGEALVPVRVTRAALEALMLVEGMLVYALIKTAVLAR